MATGGPVSRKAICTAGSKRLVSRESKSASSPAKNSPRTSKPCWPEPRSNEEAWRSHEGRKRVAWGCLSGGLPQGSPKIPPRFPQARDWPAGGPDQARPGFEEAGPETGMPAGYGGACERGGLIPLRFFTFRQPEFGPERGPVAPGINPNRDQIDRHASALHHIADR